ncbi:hypothetical protein ACFL2P_01425 [Candidatus Moduliflexota bacterium]
MAPGVDRLERLNPVVVSKEGSGAAGTVNLPRRKGVDFSLGCPGQNDPLPAPRCKGDGNLKEDHRTPEEEQAEDRWPALSQDRTEDEYDGGCRDDCRDGPQALPRGAGVTL